MRSPLALLERTFARLLPRSRETSPLKARAFAYDFQIPHVQQASFGVEHEIVDRITISGSYLYTHGEHLIRARDVNLPAPVQVTYPLFDSSGQNLTGYYTVDSFTNW